VPQRSDEWLGLWRQPLGPPAPEPAPPQA
jgi:hypothetical protein